MAVNVKANIAKDDAWSNEDSLCSLGVSRERATKEILESLTQGVKEMRRGRPNQTAIQE